MNKTSLYKFIKRTPENEEFRKSVEGAALMLKKNQGRLYIVNPITNVIIWLTSDIQEEERSDDKKLLTIRTVNSVYEFEKFAETI